MKKKILCTLVLATLFLFAMEKTHADNFYNVEFYPNNGEATTTQLVESGHTVNPINPKREGYELEGWALVSTNEQYDFTKPVTSNIQLRAIWRLINTTDKVDNPNTGIVSEIIIASVLFLASFGVMAYMICKRSV